MARLTNRKEAGAVYTPVGHYDLSFCHPSPSSPGSVINITSLLPIMPDSAFRSRRKVTMREHKVRSEFHRRPLSVVSRLSHPDRAQSSARKSNVTSVILLMFAVCDVAADIINVRFSFPRHFLIKKHFLFNRSSSRNLETHRVSNECFPVSGQLSTANTVRFPRR